MSEKELASTVGAEHDGMRISDYLRRVMGISQTLLKKVKWGGVSISGRTVTMRASVGAGDEVRVILPDGASENIRPHEMPLDIVYEDEYIIAVNKPSGIPTHPSRGNSIPTLAEGICAYLAPSPFVFRSLNRLDRDTGGIVVVAKDAHTSAILARDMKAGLTRKSYLAAVMGLPNPPSGMIDLPICRECEGSIRRIVSDNGKPALTEYRTVGQLRRGIGLLDITLHTGRTHQIRVHLSAIGHPLYADFLYGSRVEGESYLLHAYELVITHPYTRRELRLLSKPDFVSPELFDAIVGK